MGREKIKRGGKCRSPCEPRSDEIAVMGRAGGRVKGKENSSIKRGHFHRKKDTLGAPGSQIARTGRTNWRTHLVQRMWEIRKSQTKICVANTGAGEGTTGWARNGTWGNVYPPTKGGTWVTGGTGGKGPRRRWKVGLQETHGGGSHIGKIKTRHPNKSERTLTCY